MKAIFCSLFFLLVAQEIVVRICRPKIARHASRLEFTIAGIVYPVDLNHNRNFTEEERCLLEATMHNVQKSATASSKCQWLNSSLAEITKCGQAELVNSMAHNTLAEMSFACNSVEPEITPPIGKEKACDHAVAIQHIHYLLIDDFQCKMTSVCQRCQVLKSSMEKLPAACTNVEPHKQMMQELERRYTTNCASQPNASSAPTPSPTQYAIPSDPNFNKPLKEQTKCMMQATLQQLKNSLEGASECSQMEKLSDALVKCNGAAGNEGWHVLSDGERCSTTAQINYLQSMVDGDDRCSALSKHTEELKVCPTSVYAQYMLPHSLAELTANCPNLKQTDLSTTGAPTNQTSSTAELSSTLRPHRLLKHPAHLRAHPLTLKRLPSLPQACPHLQCSPAASLPRTLPPLRSLLAVSLRALALPQPLMNKWI
uniref:Secreted protein n=1 Tax=Ditylenchus dipsaci TaxID=166011 RepID=A0A915D0Q3_9BILA